MIPCLKAVAQFELLYRPVVKTPFAKIAEADALALFMMKEKVCVGLAGEIHQDIQAVALIVHRGAGGAIILPDVHTILLSQKPDRLHVADGFVLHNKGDRITPFATAEILVYALGGNDIK